MPNFTNENRIKQKHKQFRFLDGGSFVELNDLCNCVIDAANQLYMYLWPGPAKSVCQLSLLNYLTRKGLQQDI